ncbi:MAG TPA: VOC family protein [Actinophytocola sp.]|jgi:catechol 2,3-dioxygenase-like lactoylglutathione lyase family enzyme|uniref:VOC family protein n=1 Tax=Actinophytocola sp. TaxID=1872138 RepID=UPI002E0935DD|nr:VOC family protein [Actinophytocola sp.]
MTITAAKLDVVGLIVEDMARSLAFYRALGLDVPAEADTEPHVDFTLPGGMRITWDTVDTVRSFDPGWQAPSGSPRMGLAFLVDTPAGLDESLVAAGYEGHKKPWDAFWGQRYAMMHDPDGNGVDLFSPIA